MRRRRARDERGSIGKLGGKRIVAPRTFFVAAREGPLADGEINRAKAWASEILAQAQHA